MKPVLLYDGACGFCIAWVEYWRKITGDRIEYEPARELEAAKLRLSSGETLSGAEAIFTALAVERPLWIQLYRSVPGFAPAANAGYRFIAAHRNVFYQLTRILYGIPVQPAKYEKAQWLFPRLIGLVYLAAFLSLTVQITGLIGRNGILPLDLFLERAQRFLGSRAYFAVPTLFWFGSSDELLKVVCWTGVAAACCAIVGLAQRAALALMFVLYLSLVSAGQEFMSFQWDLLLLEAGFLSIFLGFSSSMIWLFRWLLFRLMFLSGSVKLLSGDDTWRNLTALKFHFETQPLPTPLAWYAHHLPQWFLTGAAAGLFAIELGAPLLIFTPPRWRRTGAWLLITLQIAIILTGNYAFFNLLTLALCIFLIEDGTLPGAARKGLATRLRRTAARTAFLSVAAIVAMMSTLQLVRTFTSYRVAQTVLSIVSPFGITNSYGLFAVMTTRRPEIIIEGSDDGVLWKPFEFRYKPGDPAAHPKWVAPHQPRLDWQMWFAALGNYGENVWLLNTMARLLEGRQEVVALLDRNPFDQGPPRMVRAMLYEYRFTDREPDWWRRELMGSYLRPVSLDDLAGLEILSKGRPRP